jgi:membrane-associated protease RseP (regulator of RpoE activity)
LIRRPAIHIGLFLLTVFTTLLVGAGFEHDFLRGDPVSLDHTFNLFFHVGHDPSLLLAGVPYSLTLMAILLAHEFGHYFACRYHGIHATLPYFLPAPTLIGTFGAFIWIRSPIYTRRALFDVGVAGPIAGFILILPALVSGVAMSKVIPGVAIHGDIIFGTPLIMQVFERIFFPGISAADISLHPVARAAWAGLLATALNLLPIGQLDGGHILYAFFGEKHRWLSRLFIFALIPLGIFYSWSWLAWAAILFFVARRHPVIFDQSKPGRTRAILGWASLAIFLFSFTPIPARVGI